MDEYIKKQTAIDALAKAMPSWTTPDGSGEFDHDIQIADEAFVDAMQVIHYLPSADVVPVRHGRWIPKFDGKFQGGAYWFDCSECGHTVTGGNLSGKHFCENCGARMDGVEDG